MLEVLIPFGITLFTALIRKLYPKTNPKLVAALLAIMLAGFYAGLKSFGLISAEVLQWWALFSATSVGLYEYILKYANKRIAAPKGGKSK